MKTIDTEQAEPVEVTPVLFGEVIREARKSKGLTQTDLAGKLRPPVVQVTVSGWENNSYRPTSNNVLQLATLLDLDAGELLRLSVDGIDPVAEASA